MFIEAVSATTMHKIEKAARVGFSNYSSDRIGKKVANCWRGRSHGRTTPPALPGLIDERASNAVATYFVFEESHKPTTPVRDSYRSAGRGRRLVCKTYP
jgi:hypothetical protein